MWSGRGGNLSREPTDQTVRQMPTWLCPWTFPDIHLSFGSTGWIGWLWYIIILWFISAPYECLLNCSEKEGCEGICTFHSPIPITRCIWKLPKKAQSGMSVLLAHTYFYATVSTVANMVSREANKTLWNVLESGLFSWQLAYSATNQQLAGEAAKYELDQHIRDTFHREALRFKSKQWPDCNFKLKICCPWPRSCRGVLA